MSTVYTRYLHKHKWVKVVEAALVSAVSAIVAFLLMWAVNDCTSAVPRSHHAITANVSISLRSRLILANFTPGRSIFSIL